MSVKQGQLEATLLGLPKASLDQRSGMAPPALMVSDGDIADARATAGFSIQHHQPIEDMRITYDPAP
jgi:hypothetical protein